MTEQIISHPKIKRKKIKIMGDSSRVITRLHDARRCSSHT